MPSTPRGPPAPADAADETAAVALQDPERFAATVELEDGERIRIRPIRAGDKRALEAGFDLLSRDSIYKRFFGPKKGLSRDELAYLTELDFHTHVALIVSSPREAGEMPVGVGRYVVLKGAEPPRAELAITVVDEAQGRGVGGILFDRLCAMAREQGIEAFVGQVLGENRAMRGLLETHGRIVEEAWGGDGIRMVVALDECGAGREL